MKPFVITLFFLSLMAEARQQPKTLFHMGQVVKFDLSSDSFINGVCPNKGTVQDYYVGINDFTGTEVITYSIDFLNPKKECTRLGVAFEEKELLRWNK